MIDKLRSGMQELSLKCDAVTAQAEAAQPYERRYRDLQACTPPPPPSPPPLPPHTHTHCTHTPLFICTTSRCADHSADHSAGHSGSVTMTDMLTLLGYPSNQNLSDVFSSAQTLMVVPLYDAQPAYSSEACELMCTGGAAAGACTACLSSGCG